MSKPKIRKKIGIELRKAREESKLSMDQVVARLTMWGIDCSKSNLSRIERNQASCRTDICAALAFLYKIKLDSLLYK